MTAAEFVKGLPAKAPKESLEGLDTTIQFKFSGEGGGDYVATARDGELVVTEGEAADAEVTVRSEGETFMKLVRKEINPMMAMMTGKVKIDNVGAMMKYAKLFGMM